MVNNKRTILQWFQTRQRAPLHSDEPSRILYIDNIEVSNPPTGPSSFSHVGKPVTPTPLPAVSNPPTGPSSFTPSRDVVMIHGVKLFQTRQRAPRHSDLVTR